MISGPGLHKRRAFFYSPVSFLRENESRLADAFLSGLAGEQNSGGVRFAGAGAGFFIRRLEWDSSFFGCPIYRLEFAQWDEILDNPARELAATLATLKADLSNLHGRYYLFAEVPSEDTTVIQALGLAGFGLIESRITYFRDLEQFEWPVRSRVRPATAADIADLRKVAAQARNDFDRYHADPFFAETADSYMAQFVENSVRGFADIVMVPAEGQGPPGAFFTASITPPERSCVPFAIGRIVLVAVGGERRGWHLRLMVEMSYHLRERGVRVAHMTTQSTNRAVIRNCEKLGYRYGRAAHILATHS